ncbi:MAG: rRNA maturation RNase YbeY [Bacteroidales bacterium]|nr:rRNA maturation RNase YbeY [Bacteroidales bacterium]
MITFETEEGFKFTLKQKLLLKKWIKRVVEEQYGKKLGDLSYIFCSDAKILEVNKQYLQHDYYTDIITFDYCEGEVVSGDMFISVETVGSNAEEYKETFERELHRVIIHGVLHLCGLKDKSEADAKKMRSAEDRALSILA